MDCFGAVMAVGFGFIILRNVTSGWIFVSLVVIWLLVATMYEIYGYFTIIFINCLIIIA